MMKHGRVSARRRIDTENAILQHEIRDQPVLQPSQKPLSFSSADASVCGDECAGQFPSTIALHLLVSTFNAQYPTENQEHSRPQPQHSHSMSALRGIMFEMRTWARCFIPRSRYVAPYYPTPDHIVERMLRVASVGTGDVVFDLGCGDGKVRDRGNFTGRVCLIEVFLCLA